MALRPILILPDPKLREVAEHVPEIDDSIRALADDMLETMYKAPGIGLAAPQIGVLKRIVVVDVAKRQNEDATPEPLVLVNPTIIWESEERSTYEEGCLSIPEFYEEVERPAVIRVEFLDRDGAFKEIEADGVLATCIQHEIDHLNGVLFIDHISRLKRARVMRKFEKAARRDSDYEGPREPPRNASRG